jgi:UPF0042 nucleotide-binding protein
MSGAGKSQALKIFEDFGFVCVDNMPLSMMEDFIKLCVKNPKQYSHIAASIDSRAGQYLDKFEHIKTVLKKNKIKYKVLFLNCDDLTLIKRYSETRLKHPLRKSIPQSIALERKMLKNLFADADEIIDTSSMTYGELKSSISKIIGLSNDKGQIIISVISFGYKYGIPLDADIVYDVRFLENPNYVASLKFKTGKDKAVKDYILKQKNFKKFIFSFCKALESSLPGYISSGKSYLTIAVGCTGGRHRSVFSAQEIAKFLISNKYKVSINHRDILRGK